MSNVSLIDSVYSSTFSNTTDLFGIDPLRDKIIPYIMKISSYSLHQIVQDERGAPDLISLREYGTDELWRYMMAYNALGSFRLLVEGTSIKIPNKTSLIAVVNTYSNRNEFTNRVVSI